MARLFGPSLRRGLQPGLEALVDTGAFHPKAWGLRSPGRPVARGALGALPAGGAEAGVGPPAGATDGFALACSLPQRPLRVFIVAGEPSGDEIGASLMLSLRRLSPAGVSFEGIGGPRMEAAGIRSLVPMASLAVMGFAELLPRLLHLRSALNITVAAASAQPLPDAVVTVDYKGFNLRLLRRVLDAAESSCLPRPAMVHYVAPSVWAMPTSAGRMASLGPLLDVLLCILPFEPPLWREAGVSAHYVGHPVLEGRNGHEPGINRRSVPESGMDPVLCLLPGSREQELRQHLPLFRSTVDILAQRWPGLRCVLPTVPHLLGHATLALRSWRVKTTVMESSTMDMAFSQSTAALASSGSITAHLAAARLPTVVTYRANWITEWYVRSRIKTPYASLPNIVLGREVMPEAIFDDATPDNLARLLTRLLLNPSECKHQVDGANEFMGVLRSAMPEPSSSPSCEAARIILRCIASRHCQQQRSGSWPGNGWR